LTELGLVDCIECGCCDVICPSHISLTSSFVNAKAEFDRRLTKERIAQQAQIHFEARRDRLETLEQQETEQQAALVDQLGSEQDERQRLIAAAVKRARQRRRTPDDSQ
jgi:electron transport complex protein RnfC